ncbi:MAG: hypothetical protein OXR68_01870 [Alphaproteobacteria bacterium]|nr:hypothetical protein [Alphaproteobacteria bacterium]MDD9919358.1 hypothetical protein [Alphaproteobacteria bacterium]
MHTHQDKAREVVQKSNHAIDVYHQEFKKEAWAERIPAELLLDLQNE